MTASITDVPAKTAATRTYVATPEDHHIAHLAAIAIGLTLFETAIPSPIPGIKPGIANIVTLFVLYRFGWRVAAWVTILRVLGGSLLLGTFLTPTFFLSLTGAACSLLMLALTQPLPDKWFGPVTHSLLAAWAHIAGQLLIVHFWLIPQASLFYFVPIFAAAALIFGITNGLIASHFLKNTLKIPE